MSGEQWQMNRAGLVNFWYYDKEVFSFEDGKLLLRGANGSGKSVTMQSILPVLLDGRKSPDRLDPFGSRARRMEDYLLGEKEVSGHEERTGYLFLEYIKPESGQYITTGIGMQARRGKPMKSWYFLITDNRRAEVDFPLTLTHTGEEIPLSEKELENRIASGGHVVKTQKEYMELVNRYVFGFHSMEAYEDLIKLLIQLRSPKLSKDFKPTVIYEILESALPPLKDDEIRYLSDTIEQMDQTQQQIEQLRQEKESAGRVVSAYDRYNRYVAAERAAKWKQASAKRTGAEDEKDRLTALEEELAARAEELEKEETMQRAVVDRLETEQEQLQHHEVWALEKRLGEIQTETARYEKEAVRLEEKRDGKQREYGVKKAGLDDVNQEQRQEKQRRADLYLDMEGAAEAASFSSHTAHREDLERLGEKDHSFDVWNKAVRGHREHLREALALLEEKERQEVRFRELERMSSEQKQALDYTVQEYRRAGRWYSEELQKLEDAVFQWIAERPELEVTQEERRSVSRLLQGLEDETDYSGVTDLLFERIDRFRDRVQEARAGVLEAVRQKQEEKRQAEATYEDTASRKMIEPERAEGTVQHRETLARQGTGAVPFYEAVEFKEEVPEAERAQLEAALAEAGILDSLLTAERVTPVEDAVFVPDARMLVPTLADYLKADVEAGSPVPAAVAAEVLQSIPLDVSEAGIAVGMDGTYQLGPVQGHAPKQEQARYIGRTSRKRHREEQLRLLEEEIGRLKQEEEALLEKRAEKDAELERIRHWKSVFPKNMIVEDISREMEQLKQKQSLQAEQLEQTDAVWKQVQVELGRLQQKLYTYSHLFSFDLTAEAVREAAEEMEAYQEMLQELQNVSVRLGALQSRERDLQETLRDIEEELDYLQGEKHAAESQAERSRHQASALEEQLKLEGADALREKIQLVRSRLHEAKEELETVIRSRPEVRGDLKRTKEQLDGAGEKHRFWTAMEKAWEESVKQEVRRGFIAPENDSAESVLQETESALSSFEKPKLLEQLTKAVLEEQGVLSEYRMAHRTEEAVLPEALTDVPEAYEAYVVEFQQAKDRRIVQLYDQGSPVTPYYVAEKAASRYEEQKRYLDEQDRALYEDIIMNHIGTILRSRIRRASRWVKAMDAIMSERDNSSGLLFSVAWKPQRAESEAEMDTKDLVALLQRDSKYLREEDLDRITQHFQSRIAGAKEMLQLKQEGTTLLQVLKEVLDYRKWFAFELSFKRENEGVKRELTDNAFFRFSGGEKAMAMYIPLFTAAYSRYQEAAAQAPYIISLDEAFAGVDDMNIRDMFEVVEQLGFDYIMNSQALWGDYDTVSSLAVAELLRPKNADFVTVMRYTWDGARRKLLTPGGMENGPDTTA
ncbi:TIGR02680 family protein [Alkalicoccus urumqiensis]|uniref:TIGR02680 family protein n=1 Tax=Alkalicoccus urumqiensis TaxID=1548213 RepID=A0A2P6MJP0_ALKUR|nr:TIGR02680 family protein [Alkalicoccus urumqiensis]PRO66506.1 TIGR02680 family protein [Alkalicoccus urumqiensis]